MSSFDARQRRSENYVGGTGNDRLVQSFHLVDDKALSPGMLPPLGSRTRLAVDERARAFNFFVDALLDMTADESAEYGAA